MKPYYQRRNTTLYHSGALEAMRLMPENSIDSICCDPPAGINFMGQKFDSARGGRNQWIAWLAEIMAEALRVTKPGGHGLVWALPRTSHWTGMALEDAGWEIRDKISHLFGQGFKKGQDVSKAIDRMRQDNPSWQIVGAWLREQRNKSKLSAKSACAAIGAHGEVNHGGAVSNWENGFSCPTWEQWIALKELLGFSDEMDAEVWRLNGRKGTPGEAWREREVVGQNRHGDPCAWYAQKERGKGLSDITAPATEAAKRFEGFHTGLKPSVENWWLIRKPLSESSIARQVLATSTGALNVGASRIKTSEPIASHRMTGNGVAMQGNVAENGWSQPYQKGDAGEHNTQTAGRYPSHLLLSHVSPDENGEGGCVRVGERRVKSGTAHRGNEARETYHSRSLGAMEPAHGPDMSYADADGLETVEDWQCAESCPIAELDRQSGVRPGYRSQNHNTPNDKFGYNTYGTGMNLKLGKSEGYNDTGGASRFFQTFPPDTGPGFIYAPKASNADKNRGLEGLPGKLKLRDNLTPEQRDYVYRELEAFGVEL